MTENPLKAYFRQPGRSIKLPSRGNYNKPEDINFEDNGEVRILPMTNQDAINLSNPDNLLNGSAIKQLILSCCPNIKNINELTVIDADAILVGIKIASNGNVYKINYKCPHCHKDDVIALDMDNLLNTMRPLPENISVRLNKDLVVNLRPYTIVDNTILTDAEYEESFALKIIQNNTNLNEEQRAKAINNSLMKIVKLRASLIKNIILSVATPQGEVTNKKFIEEFLENVPNDFVKKINEKMAEISELGISNTFEHKCNHCNEKYDAPFIFDPSSFLD